MFVVARATVEIPTKIFWKRGATPREKAIAIARIRLSMGWEQRLIQVGISSYLILISSRSA